MTPILQQLQDPHVRRLAWCLFSQPMAHISAARTFDIQQWHDQAFLENWLRQLDQNPESISEYILAGNHRLLGSYFERLWQFFFSHCPGWKLLADHIQIIHNKQTLGELDLLVRSPDDEALHIELATKWYLQIPGRSGDQAADWLGPQTKDRLDLKINKLEAKQFPFIGDEQVIDHLLRQGLPIPQQQFLIMKGGLFAQHEKQYQQASCIPDDFPIQTWCHHRDVHNCIAKHGDFKLLDKHAWLGPAMRTRNTEDSMSYEKLLVMMERHFRHSQYAYALMVSDLGPPDTEQTIERQRIMVVHDDWPNPPIKRPQMA